MPLTEPEVRANLMGGELELFDERPSNVVRRVLERLAELRVKNARFEGRLVADREDFEELFVAARRAEDELGAEKWKRRVRQIGVVLGDAV